MPYKPNDAFNDELTTYTNMPNYKITIQIEETEEAVGVIHENAEVLELNFEPAEEMPVELYDWVVEHVGNRPRDRE